MAQKWASPVTPRDQMLLLSSYDDQLPDEHPMRQLDALLEELDWSAWEACYDGHRGQQPPAMT